MRCTAAIKSCCCAGKTFPGSVDQRTLPDAGVCRSEACKESYEDQCVPLGSACLTIKIWLHCTAIVTVFDVAPPIMITTGTALSGETAAGTWAFTW